MSNKNKNAAHERSFWIKAVCIFLVILLAGSYIVAALIPG